MTGLAASHGSLILLDLLQKIAKRSLLRSYCTSQSSPPPSKILNTQPSLQTQGPRMTWRFRYSFTLANSTKLSFIENEHTLIDTEREYVAICTSDNSTSISKTTSLALRGEKYRSEDDAFRASKKWRDWLTRVFEVNGGGPPVDSGGWLHSVTAGVGWPGCGNRRRYGPRA